jgi:hypothetical protein
MLGQPERQPHWIVQINKETLRITSFWKLVYGGTPNLICILFVRGINTATLGDLFYYLPISPFIVRSARTLTSTGIIKPVSTQAADNVVV